jgi:ribosomal protein L7/L12
MDMSVEIASVVMIVALVCLAVASHRPRADIQKQVRALLRIEAKLDLLLKHASIKYDPDGNLPPEVVDAVRSGEKILAIKRYRQATGVGLKEAKDVIEEYQRRGPA